jgi:hypothetical protein
MMSDGNKKPPIFSARIASAFCQPTSSVALLHTTKRQGWSLKQEGAQ